MKWVVFYTSDEGVPSYWEFRWLVDLNAWIDTNTGPFFLVGPISLTVPIITVHAEALPLDVAREAG